jgi:hypothetical protein
MHVSLQSEFDQYLRYFQIFDADENCLHVLFVFVFVFVLFQCSGLATMGINVSLVSTSGAKTKNKEGE